jgi:hypothetical protein
MRRVKKAKRNTLGFFMAFIVGHIARFPARRHRRQERARSWIALVVAASADCFPRFALPAFVAKSPQATACKSSE